jgi:hypothetical protein
MPYQALNMVTAPLHRVRVRAFIRSSGPWQDSAAFMGSDPLRRLGTIPAGSLKIVSAPKRGRDLVMVEGMPAIEIPLIRSGGRRQLIAAFALVGRRRMLRPYSREDGAGAPVPVVSLPARGRPPEAAARRAGLEVRRESCNDRGPFS